jgi:hypothetical protein
VTRTAAARFRCALPTRFALVAMGRAAARNGAPPPPPFVPPLVALSYDVAELDALIERHFDGCALVGFGACGGRVTQRKRRAHVAFALRKRHERPWLRAPQRLLPLHRRAAAARTRAAPAGARCVAWLARAVCAQHAWHPLLSR